nr:hypothetical protein [Tanacetum cinerariifolium]
MDNALAALKNQHVICKCNMRINPKMKPKEATYQVVLDALALTTCYPAFLITAEVPVIYLHQFWATVNKHNASYRFKIDNKRFSLNVEVFREILNICPRILGQEFDKPSSEEEALSFIRELGHSGEIKYITDVIIDHLHQPWRTFVSIIERCLCGKIDNKDLKKQDKMFYPRFIKIIIYHFLKKDKSISMRNKTFMHIARDDNLLGTMRFVSRQEDTQVYGVILCNAITNQAMLDSVAYKTYYVIASGAEPLKSKKSQMKSESAISFEESPSKKKPAFKPNLTNKKASVKADKGKCLNVLLDIALTEVAQLKEATKRSKKDFHIKHPSASGDGTDFESRVPDEQQLKTSSIDEGTGTKLGVPDVPRYDSESEKESWGDSDKEDDDDDDESEDESDDDKGNNNDDNDDNDGDNGNNDDNDVNNDDDDDDMNDVDDETDNVNVNLGNEYADMTYADQGGADLHNISQESGFEQVEEDTHVTLTAIHDTQKTEGPMQSSFVSSDFTSKLLNLENVSPVDNEIASLMDTTVHHKGPSNQTSSLHTVLITAIPKVMSTFTTTIPPPHPFFNPLQQHATPTPTPTTSETTTLFPALLDFSSVFKFNERVTSLEKYLSEMKQVDQYAQDISSIHAVYELTKILMDKIEENKSHLRADYKKELYDALVKFYDTDKDLFDTYGEVFTLKRGRHDKDKDQDPSAGLDRGTKRRKSSKEVESSRDPRSKESKSSSYSKGTSRSHHKSSGKSAHAEEPSHAFDDSGMQQYQEFDTGNNDEQPKVKATSMHNWFKQPERPLTPDIDWNKKQQDDSRPPQTWISDTTRAGKPPTSFDELMDTPIDFSAFVMNRLNIRNLTQELLVGLAFNLVRPSFM